MLVLSMRLSVPYYTVQEIDSNIQHNSYRCLVGRVGSEDSLQDVILPNASKTLKHV